MSTIYSNNETININPTDDLVLYKEEFINSRIEKFLYAICALDFDDLPTPLSRIEELYKCLATGLPAPTFVPQSRVEKYLMAILDAYDASDLPAPQSRTEVLLNKILLGDTDLSDIEWLKSRYEFLLAYIIKAGGFDGDSGDFYYKLTSLTSGFTTIYDTYDMPVKNAVLRGSTLVNLVGTYKHTVSTVNKPIVWGQKRLFLTNIKPNTIYTLRAKMTEVVKGNYGPRVQIFFSTYSMGEVNTTTSTSDTLIFTSPAELSSDAHLRLIVTGSEAEATEVDFEILLLEGEHPDIKDIPYFDYMQSVKMPVLKTVGKNLITPFTKWSILSGDSAAYTLTDKRVEVVLSRWNMGVKTTIQLKPNTLYHIAWDEVSKANFNFTGTDKKGDLAPFNSFTTDYTGIVGVSVKNSTTSGTLIIDGLRINEGNTDLGYEPHKSTTVSCNEEVELCGIGDIKDELNLVTGEYTKVIYEYTFTGNEIWELKAGANNGSGYSYFSCNLTGSIPKYNYKSDANIPIYCDKLPVITYNDFDNKLKNVGINLTYFFRLNFSDCDSNNGATVEDLKAYLKANPTTVQYPISSSVKTVELSTLDQDGKETELSTFDDITHVITSSEGLIPTGEITVATKDATDVIDAGVMSLRMDDISNSQRTLEGSANAQSDDIDVTMLGTTDVYEQLL